MTNGKAFMCEVKPATYGRTVHDMCAIVLMRGHSQEKEEGCGGGGDEDFKKRVRRMMPLWGIPDQRLTG